MIRKFDFLLAGFNIIFPILILISSLIELFKPPGYIIVTAFLGPAVLAWFFISIPIIFAGLFLLIAASTRTYVKIARFINIAILGLVMLYLLLS